jgi:hypothetical protein
MSTLTPQQIQAGTKMLIDLREKLLSMGIKLKDIHSNGYHISNEVVKRGLPLHVDSALTVVNAILFENKLEFVPGFEPAKLKAGKLNQANVQVIPDQRKDEKARAELNAAVEAAELKAKADAKTFERIDGAIKGLYLRKRTETADQKARLSRYVAGEKARNAIPETIFEQVRKEIERLYKEEARIAERM